MTHFAQINLQTHFGGGEVYTQFLTHALIELGHEVTLITHPNAAFWTQMDLRGAQVKPVQAEPQIPAILEALKAPVVISHGAPHISVREHRLTKQPDWQLWMIAHMPFYQRSIEPYLAADRVFGVSEYVIDTIRQSGFDRYCEHALYGVSERMPIANKQVNADIVESSKYDWDNRKVRDRVLSTLYPLWFQRKSKRRFEKKPGLTLGIVSRITPIKQFPQLFSVLSSVLHEFPEVNVEIFGAGGYASVRDLKKAIAPIRQQVRFWGHQTDVTPIYENIDYLLTGLPEKEALGLNVIEAQACNCPVLAPNAPPFIETVSHGKTGWLYSDPRHDRGDGFRDTLKHMLSTPKLAPLDYPKHLDTFSFSAFKMRIGNLFVLN